MWPQVDHIHHLMQSLRLRLGIQWSTSRQTFSYFLLVDKSEREIDLILGATPLTSVSDMARASLPSPAAILSMCK